MINSRDPAELLPGPRAKLIAFVDKCKGASIDVVITSTYRDVESQDTLYRQGRTAPGRRVTNVAGGDSFHNWRVAFDFVPVVNGKAMWDDIKLWRICGEIGKACGLEWGGYWHSFPDMPHMQDTGGFAIADFKSGKAQTVLTA